MIWYLKRVGRDSVATRYGMDGPGIEYQWGRDFPHPARLAVGLIQPPIQFPVKMRAGRGVNLPPLSSVEVKERVEPYLYFPSGLA